MHFLLHNTGFYPCEELSFHSLTLYLTGYIPSGRCPARSRRTPHSWRVRRGRKPGERRKRRIPGARSYMATPTTRWGVLWPARGPGGRGSQEGEVNTELECSKAGRHLRREERNGAGRGRRAGRGEAGGRRPGPPQLGQG